MAATMTDAQVRFFQGFWSYFKKQERPAVAGPMRDGWDAASGLDSKGGY